MKAFLKGLQYRNSKDNCLRLIRTAVIGFLGVLRWGTLSTSPSRVQLTLDELCEFGKLDFFCLSFIIDKLGTKGMFECSSP